MTVENYQKAPVLRFVGNDARQLAATLRERGGTADERILEICDSASHGAKQPDRLTITSELPRFLSLPEANDSVLVYFSGHGFRDHAGKLYLAPIECDPANPEATGLAVEWLREQVAACKAGLKVLVLDACHAGCEKGAVAERVTAKDLAEPFRELEGVVTLASSTADQASLVWEERQQSLFTYWLCQGLRGHADRDGDNSVTIDELYEYAHQNVVRTARSRFQQEQTPVRIVRSGTPGVPVLLRLRPMTLKELLGETADKLATAMKERRLKKVALLEFTNDAALGELLGADFGLLGRYCAEEVERRLSESAADDFAVVDRRRVQFALKAQDFRIEDLGSPDALEKLSARAGGLPVIGLGTLRNRSGRVINLQCKLVDTTSGDVVATAGGAAWLNESEWAMLGRSAAVDNSDRPPPAEDGDDCEDAAIDHLVGRLDRESEKAHPMSDPKYPVRVELLIGGKIRQGVFRGNDYIVPVRQGEKYDILITNRSGQMLVMRLLVDGLNTLPEKEEAKGVATYVIGKRVNLDEARHWILDPQESRNFVVRGFVAETGAAGKLRQFTVVDASQSLAARRQFTGQLGLITAAFYHPSSARQVGTAAGEEVEDDLEERRDVSVGQLIEVIHIRYVEVSR